MRARRKPLIVGAASGFAIVLAFGVGAASGQAEPEPPSPQYDVNENGQTFGGFNDEIRNERDWPELVGVVLEDGSTAYVYREDLLGVDAKTPEDALANQQGPREITAYDRDGKTRVGTFPVGGLPGNGPIQPEQEAPVGDPARDSSP